MKDPVNDEEAIAAIQQDAIEDRDKRITVLEQSNAGMREALGFTLDILEDAGYGTALGETYHKKVTSKINRVLSSTPPTDWVGKDSVLPALKMLRTASMAGVVYTPLVEALRDEITRLETLLAEKPEGQAERDRSRKARNELQALGILLPSPTQGEHHD